MVAAMITVGASATMAASQGRRRTVNAVATTATRSASHKPMTFTSKKVVAAFSNPGTRMSRPVNPAARSMKTPVSTGYSSGTPSDGICRYGISPSAKPRSEYSGGISE